MKLEFSQQMFEKYSNISHFMKIYSVGAELFRADRRHDVPTDTTKVKVAFHSFANATKHIIIIIIIIIIGNVLEIEFPLAGLDTNQQLRQNPSHQQPQV
jgi:hypothetical protein